MSDENVAAKISGEASEAVGAITGRARPFGLVTTAACGIRKSQSLHRA